MKRTAKSRTRRAARKSTPNSSGTPGAATTIRKMGAAWAQHWNASDLDRVVAAYASDAVYLPPHHEAVHGRDAIRQYLQVPLKHGVSELAFDVTYIRQQGPVAWDVGTYRMSVPQNDGSRKEDRGKYLTVWKRVGTKWLITADSWSSDLPVAHHLQQLHVLNVP